MRFSFGSLEPRLFDDILEKHQENSFWDVQKSHQQVNLS